jgi:tetratricopeptide (TPR) repeat protein
MKWSALIGTSAVAAMMGAVYLWPAPKGDAAITAMVSASMCGKTEGLAQRAGFSKLIAGAAAWGQSAARDGEQPPPLMADLGDAHLKITTASEPAQAYFDQGLKMLHGFNHAEAARAFRYAQKLDPKCAMCFWGEAFALGPNINASMAEADNPAAYAAAQAAVERTGGTSPVEQALIEAMGKRYSKDWPADRAPFDAAFATNMATIANRFADNDLVQILAAEADMDTQPWDYWEPGGRDPKDRAGEAIKRIETVLARSPNNAGAIHLYIHLAEASTNPWRAEDAAGRLDKAAANAGHLVHMPGHIYYRVGRFKDSIRQNIIAAEVDERFIRTAHASPTYQFGYYPHNLHFVATSAQLGGDAKNALLYAEKLEAQLPMAMAAEVPMAQVVKAAPWFVQADYGDPKAVLAKPAPDKGVDYVSAAWRYARAMAHLRAGDIAASRAEASEMTKIGESGDLSGMIKAGQPAKELIGIYGRVLDGRALMAEKKYAEAIVVLEGAEQAQEKIPYTEPPYVYFPTGRTLGAAYVAAGRYGEAEQAFLRVLIDNPNDALAYWGIAEARARSGDKAGARAARALFKNAWLGKRKAVSLASL